MSIAAQASQHTGLNCCETMSTSYFTEAIQASPIASELLHQASATCTSEVYRAGVSPDLLTSRPNPLEEPSRDSESSRGLEFGGNSRVHRLAQVFRTPRHTNRRNRRHSPTESG